MCKNETCTGCTKVSQKYRTVCKTGKKPVRSLSGQLDDHAPNICNVYFQQLGTLVSLVHFITFFQRGGFILRPSFSQDCNCWEYCICFGGACMQYNRQFKTERSFYQFCIPYGTSAKPSFSWYGFHFYTITVRSF